MMGKVKKRFFPRCLSDFAASSFVLLMIPAIYYFELFVVLPTIHPSCCFWYYVHFTLGTFLMINITSNLAAVMIVDTSIVGEILPATVKSNWRLCTICETVAPPRSWHCNICNTCILKRDHHCIFSASCIGFYNYRYFYMFTLYTFLATLYASYFNSYFIWSNAAFQSYVTILKMLFPLATLVFGFDFSVNQCYLLLYLVNLAGVVFTFVLLYIHTKLIKSGLTQFEYNHKIKDYDYGLQMNIKMTFGERWYIAWFFPFIHSELPSNGINWMPSSNSKDR